MKKSEQYQHSNNTPQKQDAFKKAIGLHMDIVQKIWKKYPGANQVYRYFDLHGGMGVDPDGNEGSPLIFKRIADEKKVKFRARVWEGHSETYASLQSHTKDIQGMTVYHEDHNDMDRSYLLPCDRKAYGVAYVDPSNAEVPIEALLKIRDCYPKVDFMIYIAAASYKRQVNQKDYEDLASVLHSLKPHWIIRKPIQKFQWTFLIGSSWFNFPDWKAEGFHKFLTAEGGTYFEQACYTKTQIREMYQPPLFEPAYATYEEYLRHPLFRAIRRIAMDKAEWICQRCKKARATEVHHLKYPPWGEFDTVDNLLPVCHRCHCEIEGKEN